MKNKYIDINLTLHNQIIMTELITHKSLIQSVISDDVELLTKIIQQRYIYIYNIHYMNNNILIYACKR